MYLSTVLCCFKLLILINIGKSIAYLWLHYSVTFLLHCGQGQISIIICALTVRLFNLEIINNFLSMVLW